MPNPKVWMLLSVSINSIVPARLDDLERKDMMLW